MIEDEILPIVDVELWGVYDNATDKPVAYGTYDETVRMLRMTKDEFELMKALYSKQNANYRENIKFLVQSFDCWAGLDIKQWFDNHFTNDCYETNKTNLFQDNVNIFQQCCDTYGEFEGRNRKFPLNMTLFLYAIIIYLQNQSIVSDNDFRRRIRIVRNLIWNSQYEIRADGQRNNMPQLLAETKDIILSGTISSGTGYNQKQKEEEKAKIEWLNNFPLEQDRLFHLEDCPLLYGCVAIVGLDNYRNFDKFRSLFEIQNRKLIHRALLTCGDYTQEVTWNQHHFMGNNNDSTWKDLFHPTDKRVGFSHTSETINVLLDKLTEPSEAELNAIIDTYQATSRDTFDWMYYFIKYPSMLKGNEGIYWMEEYPYNMYALHHSTLRGYNWQALAIAVLECAPDKFTLGNWAYNQYEPLQKDGIKIIVRNWGFELIDSSTNTVSREIHVPQNNDGIDCVDRIEFLLQNL